MKHAALRSRDDIVIERAPDQFDAIHLAQIRDLAITEVDREIRQLRAVQAALRRTDNGSLGVCLPGDGAIAEQRLCN